ncbi:MAG: tetratricopeptide repeat protein [Gemmataceae bacterium]
MQLPSKDAKAKTTKPVSEWESVRRQLRNEKEEPKKPEASKPPTLSDVLLKVLAENGHHFSRLGEKESLTIVLTVHEQGRSKAIRKPTEIPAKTSSPGPTGITPHSSKMRNLEMLGDLCMKQGRYNEAMDAFAKVLKLHRDSFTKAGLSSLDDAGRKREASVRLKLAQSLLLTGDDKQARTMLDQIITLLKNADDKKQTAPATKPAAAELPVKLIISAPKKLLDQVKEGKITFEEFRAKTHVETLRFDDHRSHK